MKFLTSTRFWAMVLGAVAVYLNRKGILGDAEFALVGTILGGFIGVRTIDRLGEKVGCKNND